jgi:hypothetical protein
VVIGVFVADGYDSMPLLNVVQWVVNGRAGQSLLSRESNSRADLASPQG